MIAGRRHAALTCETGKGSKINRWVPQMSLVGSKGLFPVRPILPLSRDRSGASESAFRFDGMQCGIRPRECERRRPHHPQENYPLHCPMHVSKRDGIPPPLHTRYLR